MKIWIALLSLGLCLPSLQAHEKHAADDMARVANAFLSALSDSQKDQATFEFQNDERLNWHFIPRDRKGLSFKEMEPAQRYLAQSLLASGMSIQGLIKASTIMSLEQVLQDLEGPGRRFSRDPELYFFSVFGTPAEGETWGWRVEGHHLCVNFTIVEGEHIAATPSFFGTNPGLIKEGPRAGLKTLRAEEDFARHLVKSLNSSQREKAVIDTKAPSDILTSADKKVSALENKGIGWNGLNGDQKESLWTLVKLYVERHRSEVAEADLEKIKAAGQENIVFAWAGGLNEGEGHYYRIQGPTFLLEYDNTQNGANHVHSVYRDFEEDFGRDLLAEHYQNDH